MEQRRAGRPTRRRASAEPLRRERDAPASGVGEALARAERHGRAAIAESLRTIEALLDAAALATRGSPAELDRFLAPAVELLESLALGLGPVDPPDGGLAAAIAEGLDAEIARWEVRARDDSEARAVLRAFLGVRELLWEIGIRSTERPVRRPGSVPGRPQPEKGADADACVGSPRVQRVRVHG